MSDVDVMLRVRDRLLQRRSDLLAELERIDRALGGAILREDMPPPRQLPHDITQRQAFALAKIAHHIDACGYPPTMRELAKAIGGTSSNGACDHVRRLVAKGFLSQDKKQARALKLTDKGRAALGGVAEAAE